MAVRRTKRTDRRSKTGSPWTRAAVARLTRLYSTKSNRDLAVLFGRSELGIMGKARGLGLEKNYAGGYRRQLCYDPRLWSVEEEELLTELWPTTPNEEIAEQIGRTLDAIANKARKLGLRKSEFWSEKEDELLRALYRKLSYVQLARRLGRSKGSVQIRVITLGLECKVRNWTEDKLNFLKESYPGTDYRVIAKKLGRTVGAVARMAGKLGIARNWLWTQAEIQELKELHPEFTARQIAEELGHTFEATRRKISQLGLHKDNEQDRSADDESLVYAVMGDVDGTASKYDITRVHEFLKDKANEPEMANV